MCLYRHAGARKINSISIVFRLLEIVEKRNEIIETMENERLRRTAEDLSVTTQLGIFTRNSKYIHRITFF